jgi:hypothetical protein
MRSSSIQFFFLAVLLSFPQIISAQWETLGNTPYAYGNGPALFVYFLAPVGLPEVGYCSFMNTDTLYKTTDFGKTWKANFASSYALANWVTDIVFKDSLLGWICTVDATGSGDTSKMDGRIYSTSDGGNSWQEVSPLRASFWKLGYNPRSRCLIADGNEITGKVISHDDGLTFTETDWDLYIGNIMVFCSLEIVLLLCLERVRRIKIYAQLTRG